MKYLSLEARVIASYLESLPDFAPAGDREVDRDEQARFYGFIRGAYARAAENPAILGLDALHPDDAYPDRFDKSRKPALAANIRRAADAVDAFFAFLAEAGEKGATDDDGLTLPADFSVPEGHGRALGAVGLKLKNNRITSDKWPGIFRAWKLLSYPCEGEVALRQRAARMEKCAFVENAPGLRGTFARLIGGEAASLTAWLEAHGYAREAAVVDGEITALRYTKNGVGAQFLYDRQAATPACAALVQRGWQEVLSRFDEMGKTLRAFVAECSKTCDGCADCACEPQPITVEGKRLALCPLSQNHYAFEKLDAKTVAGVIECLRFMENKLPKEQVQKQTDTLRSFSL